MKVGHRSEPLFAMRWLATSLSWGECRFLCGNVDRQRDYLVDVAACYAASIGSVPVPFDDHVAPAFGAGLGRRCWRSGHQGTSLLPVRLLRPRDGRRRDPHRMQTVTLRPELVRMV